MLDDFANPMLKGFSDPVSIEVWHPSNTGWTQAVQENVSTTTANVSLSIGQAGQFRAKHDGDIANRANVAPGSLFALRSAASSELGQTARITELLDELAGTYTLNHHTLQIIRENNTVDTPMTSTSSDQVTASPSSGLKVSPRSVTYALSAAQSAQEAIALGQSGGSQPVSAASLLGSYANSSGVQFVKSPGLPSSGGYTTAQNNVLSLFSNAGYDLLVPATAPSGSSPLGFMAVACNGTSAFVLDVNGQIYKGAADQNPVNPSARVQQAAPRQK